MNYQFEILEKSTPYDGFLKMEKYRLRHQTFSGDWTPEITRECLERGHAVAVLPYDPDQDRVVLIEQFRIGALDNPGGPWLLEIVAGVIGAGESKQEVARREAKEEAGCDLLALEPVCDFLVSPGGTSENITLFCGRVDSSGIGGIHGLDKEHEDIRVHVVSRDQALALLRDGRIYSATAMIALQWLALNHQNLLIRWGYSG